MTRPASKTTPYQRIKRAAKRGTGCYLSPEDVYLLYADDAIKARADADDDPDCEREAP